MSTFLDCIIEITILRTNTVNILNRLTLCAIPYIKDYKEYNTSRNSERAIDRDIQSRVDNVDFRADFLKNNSSNFLS